MFPTDDFKAMSIPLDTCPVCNQGEASMGSSEWGHNVLCCSDFCGKRHAMRIQIGKAKDCYRLSGREIDTYTTHERGDTCRCKLEMQWARKDLDLSKLALRISKECYKRGVKPPSLINFNF